MVFDNVIHLCKLNEELWKICGCPVAWIPFCDCKENTSYYISQDGKNVFVGVSFAEYIQIKQLSIIPAGKRSTASVPFFKRRNKNNSQCSTSIASAVYGAFVLKDRLPNFKLRHIDGNLNNCNLKNLATADETPLAKNLTKLSTVYLSKFRELVHRSMWFRRMRIEEAEDFVSDAFSKMCLSRKEIKAEIAERLWWFLTKEKIFNHNNRNRIDYEVYELIDNYPVDDCAADANAEYQSVYDRLTPDCAQVVGLIMKGYNQREVAEILGCSQSWVSILLKQTKKCLKNEQ